MARGRLPFQLNSAGSPLILPSLRDGPSLLKRGEGFTGASPSPRKRGEGQGEGY